MDKVLERAADGETIPTRANGGSGRLRRIGLLLAGVVIVVLAGRHLAAAGASWTSAWQLITGLGWRWLLGLGLIWQLGLWIHTVVLTASMPGLTHRRALTLNLSGSAVSNVLPLGGVAGTVLNLTMVRGWGHSNLDFARFVVVSKAWDLLAKLLMPGVAVGALFAWDLLEPDRYGQLLLLCTGAAGGTGLLVVAALLGRVTLLLRVVGLAERLWRRLWRRVVCDPAGWTDAVTALLAGTDRLVRRGWATLSWGMAGYWLLQGLLLWLCFAAVHAPLPVPVIVAALTAERALTLLAITPGGAGLVEAGTTAVLVGLGADPTSALAGVLLFRGFVFAAEIPAGGAATGVWLATCRRLAA